MSTERSLRKEVQDLRFLIEQYAAQTEDHEIIAALANETDIDRAIVATLKEAEEAKAFASAIKELLEAYKARKERYEHKAERLRAIVALVMQDTGLTKIVSPAMTVSVRAGQPSIIVKYEADAYAAEAFPELVKVKTTYAYDMKALREALENGDASDLAQFGNAAPILSVRVK